MCVEPQTINSADCYQLTVGKKSGGCILSKTKTSLHMGIRMHFPSKLKGTISSTQSEIVPFYAFSGNKTLINRKSYHIEQIIMVRTSVKI